MSESFHEKCLRNWFNTVWYSCSATKVIKKPMIKKCIIFGLKHNQGCDCIFLDFPPNPNSTFQFNLSSQNMKYCAKTRCLTTTHFVTKYQKTKKKVFACVFHTYFAYICTVHIYLCFKIPNLDKNFTSINKNRFIILNNNAVRICVCVA